VTDLISANSLSERLPPSLAARLRVPLLVAPMFRISGPDLVVAACKAGAIGAFPAVNARTTDMLDSWLDQISRAVTSVGTVTDVTPHCVNIVMSRPDWRDHVACLVNNGVEIAVTSVGAPGPAVPLLHRAGCLVFADVATLGHARKAVAAGVDGLVLLTAGAGGQTGWLNPFAFVRAVRDFYDGPVLLAGGIADGVALRAAVTLGADLGYMGTPFIAAAESMASDAYRAMLIDSDLDDVLLTRAFTGLPANFLRPAVVAVGLDPDNLDEDVTPEIADASYGGGNAVSGPMRWSQVFSAGHTVSAVAAVQSAADIVADVTREFYAAPRAVAANTVAANVDSL
jgi:nitronate monooxygenase